MVQCSNLVNAPYDRRMLTRNAPTHKCTIAPLASLAKPNMLVRLPVHKENET